jgi:hypothetical protein
MKLSNIKKAFVLVIASSVGVLGCELIVDFDRTRIPVEGVAEAGPGDDAATETDAETDTGTEEPDAGEDAAPDAEITDASVDDADGSLLPDL